MKTKLISLLFLVLVLIQNSVAPAADTNVGGEVYSFFTTDITDNGQGKDYNRFDLSRVYINVKSKLSPEVSVRITVDVDKMDGTMRETYLKYAYLDWNVSKVIPYSTVRFGLQQTGWIDYMNKVWGRRYVAKTLMDEYKILPSADYGISHLVKFPQGYGHGAIQLLQGPGYKGEEENRYKDISAFVFLRPLVQVPDLAASMIGAYYYKGFSDEPDINSENKKDRMAAMASLAYGGMVRISGEYFLSWDRTDPEDTEDVKKDGISLFGDVRFPMAQSSFLKQIALIGRYDIYDPNKDKDDDQETYLIAGAEWTVTDGFSLMPNFQRYKVKDEEVEDMLVLNALFAF
jgi:hypothetical protein